MRGHHLLDEELLALLLGEVPSAPLDHVQRCELCQRRVGQWQALLQVAGQWEPPKEERRRVLARVFETSPQGGRPWLWLAAAAATLVLAFGVLWQRQRWAAPPLNADVVLEQVEEALATDPLSLVVEGEVVAVLVPDGESGERSKS